MKFINLYRLYYENFDHQMDKNGEYYILQRLADADLTTFFDVGANVGDWSKTVLDLYPDGTDVYAFEIAPETLAKLQSTAGDRIKINAFGLSDEDGVQEILFYRDKDTVSTLVTDNAGAIHPEAFERVSVPVRSGDSFCREQGIESVDFLKIDTEGAENRVLAGFSKMIAAGKIVIIQFEYGMANIYSRFLLKDFYDLLGAEYAIGKLYPSGVDFKPYSPRDENFSSPNFLAMRRDRSDLIERVKLRHAH